MRCGSQRFLRLMADVVVFLQLYSQLIASHKKLKLIKLLERIVKDGDCKTDSLLIYVTL